MTKLSQLTTLPAHDKVITQLTTLPAHDTVITQLTTLPAHDKVITQLTIFQKQQDVHTPDTHYIHAVDIVDLSVFPTSQMLDVSVKCDFWGIEDGWLVHVIPHIQVGG